MITSHTRLGDVLEDGLRQAKMLNLSKYGLSMESAIRLVHHSLMDVARAHFEQDKEDYYETRTGGGLTNGKFGAGPGTYDSVEKKLTITMTPSGSEGDIGKAVTFFGSSTKGYVGIITDYSAVGPYYIIDPWWELPDMASVTNVTVMDWLITGDVLTLGRNNEIFSPEKVEIYDLTNRTVIDVEDYDAFNRYRVLETYSAGTKRWARLRKSSIEFASGSQAPDIGVLRISAYWVPSAVTNLASGLQISETRIPEVLHAFVSKLLQVRNGTLDGPYPAIALEDRHESMKPAESRRDTQKVR